MTRENANEMIAETAARIKALRNLTGMSQSGFGRKYGIPMRTVQNWENGTTEAPEYVVAMLEQIVWENELGERLRWYVVDDCGTDYFTEPYDSKAEALEWAEEEWDALTDHDRRRRDGFFVGLIDSCGDVVIVAKRWK